MNRSAITAAALLLFLTPLQTRAQERWSVEVRGGVAVATQDVVDESLGNGIGLDGTFRYRFMPHVAAYAGWDWVHFGPDASFAGADVDFEETGYAVGLRWEHPLLSDAGLGYWVRGGATYDHIELENSAGDITADSGHGYGWEAGAGVTVELGAVQLTPGARYRSLTRDVDIGGTTTSIDLRYVTLGVGLAFTF